MIIRQLSQEKYSHLHNALVKKARVEPLEASYTVDMTINIVEYAIKVQPEENYKIAVLQAFRIDRDKYGANFELITTGSLLSSFLNILLYQGI